MTDQKVNTGPQGPQGNPGAAGQPQAATFGLNTSPPAIDDATTVMAGGTLFRDVMGYINVTNTIAVSALVDCKVETAVGSGVYVSVQQVGSPVLLALTTPCPFCFRVPAGRRYKFAKTGDGTAAFGAYSVVDV